MQSSHVVIIPHYNDANRLRRCLDALMKGDTEGVDVVVVDNGSTDPIEDLKTDFQDVRFVHEPGKGAALARNRGVMESDAEGLIFLDADCVPAPDWLAIAKRLCGSADIIGGAISVFDESTGPRSGSEAFETVFAFNYRSYFEEKGFFVTANLVTTRNVFEAVGPFINGMSEDAEWCHRAREKGFELVLDESLKVAHPTRSDWPALVRKWRRITCEAYQTRFADGQSIGGRLAWMVRAVATAASGVAHAPRLLASSKLDGPGERIRGLLTLMRLRLLRSYWMLRQALGSEL